MRGIQVAKFFKAIDLLTKPEGITLKEMGTKLGLQKRSIYRLIKLVEGLGFPLWDEKIPLEKEKRWRLDESYVKKLPNINLPDINLSLNEIISLFLLKSEAKVFKGTEVEKNIKSAFGKLGAFIPEATTSKIDKIKALFITTSKLAKDYTGKEEIIEKLTDAMLNKQTCEIDYHSFYKDKISKFKIDSLHFFENDGGLYLMVNTTDYGDIRILAVERLKKINLTGETFKYPEKFDPEKLLEPAFDIVYDDPIEVKIWFPVEQVKYIKERKWSKEQKIHEHKDGSITLSMSTSGWWDIKRWVLSHGAMAEVLEPEELREEIAEEFEAALENYK